MTFAGEADPRTIGLFALLGAVSGALTTGVVSMIPESMELLIFSWLELNPLSLAPGLVFGLLVGAALGVRGVADARHAVAYAAASTVSYLAAYTLAINTFEFWGALWLTGLIAGLFGSACLTGAAAVLFPFVRRLRPCLLMLLAGCLLGALLEPFAGGFWATLAFFAIWQGGYAAAFATALPRGAAPVKT